VQASLKSVCNRGGQLATDRGDRVGDVALRPDRGRLGVDIGLYRDHRYGEGLPLVRTTIVGKFAKTDAALPALFGAEAGGVIPAEGAFDGTV
jgi:hypothetical protein